MTAIPLFSVLFSALSTVARTETAVPRSDVGAFDAYNETLLQEKTPVTYAKKEKPIGITVATVATVAVTLSFIFLIIRCFTKLGSSNKKSTGLMRRRMSDQSAGDCVVSINLRIHRPCMPLFDVIWGVLESQEHRYMM